MFVSKHFNQEECKAAGFDQEVCWKCHLYNQCSIKTLKITLDFLTIFFALTGLKLKILVTSYESYGQVFGLAALIAKNFSWQVWLAIYCQSMDFLILELAADFLTFS